MEIPDSLKDSIQKTLEFAHSFYKNETLKQLKLNPHEGYKDWKNAQAESLYLPEECWKEALPAEEMKILAIKMKKIAKDILEKTLILCKVQPENWSDVTGGFTADDGLVHFSFNHYRIEKAFPGLFPHRDFGLITVLFINKVGLQGKLGEKWVDVPPLKDHFIINFGRSFETLINDPTKLIAI